MSRRRTVKRRSQRSQRSQKTWVPHLPGGESAQCHPRLRNKTRRGRECLPSAMRSKLGSVSGCAEGDELCMVRKSRMSSEEKERITKEYFRPEMPTEWKNDDDMWLSNEDIDNVMKQYEEAYPHFKFLGVTPIDFSAPNIYGDKSKCLKDQFCHVNLEEERKKGKTLIGAIFNLDHHLKNGSHWVAAALDLKRGANYYFDSYGMPPPPQISRFIRSFKIQNPHVKLQQNGRRFQYGNSECGVYSMYFLIRMIAGDSFRTFVRRPISDKDIHEFRKQLYSMSPAS